MATLPNRPASIPPTAPAPTPLAPLAPPAVKPTASPRGYGYLPDKLDQRDALYRLTIPPPARVLLPTYCDLTSSTSFFPPVYDQGQLGSCTANAIAAAFDFTRKKEGVPFLTPSRLFVYYNERVMEGSVAQDAGAEIRDGMKSVASLGVCPESEWPYVESQFSAAPPAKDYTDALLNKVLQYSSVSQTEYFIKHCLSLLAQPVVFGFSVFDAFESDAVAISGMVPYPSPSDAPIGGHAVCLVGYNDNTQLFLVRNSWGPDWGVKGYFYLPYKYVLNPDLAQDFWTMMLVEPPAAPVPPVPNPAPVPAPVKP